MTASKVQATTSTATEAATEAEHKNEYIVRHKLYYKADKIELGLYGGLTPLDSTVSHWLVGGKIDWHFTDHFGWEILDFHYGFPSTSSFTTGLVESSIGGLSNLQTNRIKMIAGTSLLVSPVYGKIRFFGKRVLYLDVYAVFGLGFVNQEVLKVSTTAQNVTATQSILETNWDLMFNFGIGFKIFLNDAMGLVFDMRDYVVHAKTYGSRSLRSNFVVTVGLTFYIPPFG